MWGLSAEIGSQAVAAAEAVLEECDGDPAKVVKLRIPGVKQLVSDKFPDMHPEVVEPATRIVWQSAVGTCKPNNDKIRRRIEYGEDF